MLVNSDRDMRHNERGYSGLHRISHERQTRNVNRHFQQFDAIVRECIVLQVRARRDTIHLSMLWPFLLHRLVSL